MGWGKITYEAIWSWVESSFDLKKYQTYEELLYDVESQFVTDDRFFPQEAKDLIRDKFEAMGLPEKRLAEFIETGRPPEIPPPIEQPPKESFFGKVVSGLKRFFRFKK